MAGKTRAGKALAESAPAPDVETSTETAETLLRYYREMVLIRSFELTAAEMYARAKIGGYCHLNLGEEAAIVGLMDALQERDYLFTNYREHGYALARGLGARRVMAELFGKRTGVSGGRGGSMHMFDMQLRMLGGYGIVGGQIPPATGAALALSTRNAPGPDAEVVMCQLGDGTTNIGAFHESLNLAGVWNLPIVYVIINNRLGMATTVEMASAEPELYKRGCSYRIPGERVDGNDAIAVRDAALRALERARVDRKPALLEVMTFRLRGHSVVDPARYRSTDDTDLAKQSDPLPALRARLLESGILDEAALNTIEAEADATVKEAVAFADDGAEPGIDELFDYVYATSVTNAPSSLPGDPLMVDA